jgi:hypothetical protein
MVAGFVRFNTPIAIISFSCSSLRASTIFASAVLLLCPIRYIVQDTFLNERQRSGKPAYEKYIAQPKGGLEEPQPSYDSEF